MFGRCEAEVAAAFLLWTLTSNGDEWRPVRPKEIGEAIRELLDSEAEPPPWMNNPFARPDFYELVERGFAVWSSDEIENRPIEFTPAGLDQLRESPWVREAS
ncbi:MAG: hypothetical protein AAF721_00270 [Myxococcota bacterium]